MSKEKKSKEQTALEKEVKEKLVLIGQTKDKKPLFIYIDTDEPLAYYCLDEEDSYVGDVRFPRQSDQFLEGELEDGTKIATPLQFAIYIYKAKANFEITEEIIKNSPVISEKVDPVK